MNNVNWVYFAVMTVAFALLVYVALQAPLAVDRASGVVIAVIAYILVIVFA